MTNRDFYLAVLQLIDEHKTTTRSLEDYIHTVLVASFEHAEYNGLTLEQLLGLLRAGFVNEVTHSDSAPISLFNAEFGFGRWFSIASRQIRDLREMRATQAIDDPQRYFGISASSGETWYNFDPLTFIECGAAGYFDGWRPGDPTGRISLGAEGSALDEKLPVEFEGLYWRSVSDFFHTCQIYE